MKILVTGGCGYIGSVLLPYLLTKDHQIVNLDLQWFGNGFLPQDNEHLINIKADLRDTDRLKPLLEKAQIVIHLSGMTNDNACRENPQEAKSINVDAFLSLVRLARASRIKRFIFISSSAAYGNTRIAVPEIHPLNPTTPYGLYKKACEELLGLTQSNGMRCYILRPAGVFGYAPRMRFDLMVNMMTAHAALKGEILVAGGEQVRPHVHIRDLIEVILRLLTANINSNTFNVVYTNQSVNHTAKVVKSVVEKWMKREISIVASERTDDRSYSVSGERLREILSFDCMRNIGDGVAELCHAFKRGQWADALTNPLYSNVPAL